MTAIWFFAGLCIVGFIGLVFILSPVGKKWIQHLDE